VFGHVEEALYDYDLIKRKIEELREDIITAAPVVSEGSKVAVSDPTAGKAGRLISNKVICRMDETIRAIDRSLALLSDDHRNVFELHYRQGLSWQRVCEELPASRATFFNYRRQLVKMVANQMGYEVV
jgi:RinA family phage transcriptional activator